MLTLEIFDDGSVFRHGDDYDRIVEELDDAVEQRDGGSLPPAKYLKTLKALVDRHPHFIDGHAHLGYALMEDGKPKLALQACLHGLEVGERAIPANYAGSIEWGFLENRPFLRAAWRCPFAAPAWPAQGCSAADGEDACLESQR